MKITRVEIENVLAFGGSFGIDLPTTAGHDLVLIRGPSGTGKTSLLMAMHAALVGVEDRTIRTVGFPPKTMSPDHFLLGDHEGWRGLWNRDRVGAVRGPHARIALEMSGSGKRFAVERIWTCTEDGYREQVVVEHRGVELTDDAARTKLRDLFPSETISLFFGRAEEAKGLIESNIRLRNVLERLAGTGFIRVLGRAAHDLHARGIRGTGTVWVSSQSTSSISQAKWEVEAARSRLADAEVRVEQARDQLEELDRELERLRILTGHRGTATELRRKLIDAERSLFDEISNRIRELPLLVNPDLLAETARQAGKASLDAAVHPERDLVALLPDWLRRAVPDLDEGSKAYILAELLRDAPEHESTSYRPFSSVTSGKLVMLATELETTEREASDQRRWMASAYREWIGMSYDVASRRGDLQDGSGPLERLWSEESSARVERSGRVDAFRDAERTCDLLQAAVEREQSRLRKLEAEQAARTAARERPGYDADLDDLGSCLDEIAASFFELARQRLNTALDGIVERWRSQGYYAGTLSVDGNANVFLERGNGRVAPPEMTSRERELAGWALLRALQIATTSPLPVAIDDPPGLTPRTDRGPALPMFLSTPPGQTMLLTSADAPVPESPFLRSVRLAGEVDLGLIRSESFDASFDHDTVRG